MVGTVAILNVSAGDTKLTFDPKMPAEVARAAKIVKDMLRRGFALLVEVGSDDKGPLYRRVHDFDEATTEYIIAGMFLERSPRSGVTYLFRRLKPTVAIAAGGAKDDGMRILAALCMHPIAYYAGSWAGAMCPTDDVIAHLALMRGDEHMFWKRCNQHPPYRPEAGL